MKLGVALTLLVGDVGLTSGEPSRFRRRQIRWLQKGDILGQVAFMALSSESQSLPDDWL